MHSSPRFDLNNHTCINALKTSSFLHNVKLTNNAHNVGMSELLEKTKQYIRHVMAEKDWSSYRLAKESGVANSTISRFLNSPDPKHVLSSTTINKIENASGITFHPGTGLPDPDTRDIIKSIAFWLAERPGVVNPAPEDFAEAFVSLYDYYLEASSASEESKPDMAQVVDFVAHKLAVNG